MGFKGRSRAMDALVHHIDGDCDQSFGRLVNQGLSPHFSCYPGAEIAKSWMDAMEALLEFEVVKYGIAQAMIGGLSQLSASLWLLCGHASTSFDPSIPL